VIDGQLVTYYENLTSKTMKDFYDERVQKYSKTFEHTERFRDRVDENSTIYFTMMDEYDLLFDVYNRLKARPDIDMALYRDIYGEGMWYLEIYSVNASKYNAAKFLREQGGYDRLVGFGDNRNDIPLLRACDEFYAVENAVDELKQLATGVIGANVDNGVARFLSLRKEESSVL
jgi:hydroxymethylpyrimidine pyrophosphatase-like HAD family hydrolase